jgi:hypothetical protein
MPRRWNPGKKEPVVYPYTTGIAFLVTPKVSPLSGRDITTIADVAPDSMRFPRFIPGSSSGQPEH